ncbi:hypothetical protein Hanom_Chr16g01438431 [Helianthus anomalus]
MVCHIFSKLYTTLEKDKRKAKSKGGAASENKPPFIIPIPFLKTLLQATMVTIATKFIE